MFGDLPATGLFARHVRNLELTNVEIAVLVPDARPALWLRDIEGADCFRVRVPQGAPAFDLREVKEFRSFGSRRLADISLDNVESRKI
jgi:hypothetical protein